jgi:N,N'-diacetylchitobiose transport system substrate-binding protein
MTVKRKIAAVASIATVLTAAACSSSASHSSASQAAAFSTDGKGKTITVWLMQDAQKGWPEVVDSAVSAFEKETGAKVNIQWQTWTNYSVKLDTALLSGNAPDVVELGNTQTAKYIAAGAFEDLTSLKSKFDNSSQWLDSLAASGESGDGTKTYAIPYYAGARVLIYRKDLFAAAGITTAPSTLEQLSSDLDQVKAKNASTPNFSALYLPGKDWYTATSFGAGTFGVKGVIAKSSGGKWTGTLTDPAFVQGVKTWQQLQKSYSVGGATSDESNQDALMAKGNIAAIIGNGWEASTVVDPKANGNPALAGKLAEIPVPGTSAGSPTPAFLGGSDIAVPSHAANTGLGAEFTRIFLDSTRQSLLAKHAIPNNKTLVAKYQAADPANQATGIAASAPTWFIPNSQFWSQTSDETALQNAYSAIAAGSDPATALGTAQTTIVGDLNGS